MSVGKKRRIEAFHAAAELAAGCKACLQAYSHMRNWPCEHECCVAAGSVRFVRDAPVNGPSSGKSGSPQRAIFWGGSGSSAADRSFSFEDFPLDALLGRSAADSDALPKPLVPMEVSCL